MNLSNLSPVASLRGVDKRYGKRLALDHVDLEIRPGELLALLGPNGAGKSTSINLLLGLLRPDMGQVRLFGRDPQELAARRHIGVMLQSAQLPATLRVGELLRLTASYYPHPRDVLESARLAGVADLLGRSYKKLSGGQQRRVQFALAICGRPRLLFLDEPTVGMDIEARQKQWAAMRALVAEGCSVVLTTHYLEEAEALAQRVVVLGSGRVLTSGSVDEVRSRVTMACIRCRSAVAPARALDWPDVEHAEDRDGRLEILTAQPEHVLRRLLDTDETVADLEVRRAGLAEAFRELTREETSSPAEAA